MAEATANQFQIVRSLDIRKVVDDVEWQALRKSFLGRWKKEPDALTDDLRAYLGQGPWEDPLRLRRVLNYLTGSGFRCHRIGNESSNLLREEVRAAWAKGVA